MIISLIGFMGCGKSSVGRRLSQLLCCRFMDLDEEIVNTAGRSIPEIFATEGEARFREIELESLLAVVEGQAKRSEGSPHLILALGGGAVMTEECAESVHKNTVCIYLRASVNTLLEHLANEVEERPLLATTTELRTCIEELISQRTAIYENTAHIVVDTDNKTIEQIAYEISTLI